MCSETPNFQRNNGLTWPLDILQVVVWFLCSLLFASFFITQYPLMFSKERYYWTFLFSFTYLMGIFLFTITTLTNHYLPPPPDQDHSRYCRFCQKRVPSFAKHCRMCNRCRVSFDHHCRFVNNCVTGSNYLQFFYGCLCLVSSNIVNFVQLIIIIYRYFHGEKSVMLSSFASHLHTKESPFLLFALISLNFIMNLMMFVPIFVLVYYHIYLQSRMLSTYDYLTKNIPMDQHHLSNILCQCRTMRIGAQEKYD